MLRTPRRSIIVAPSRIHDIDLVGPMDDAYIGDIRSDELVTILIGKYEQQYGYRARERAWYDYCIRGKMVCGLGKNRLTRAESNRYDMGEWPYQLRRECESAAEVEYRKQIKRDAEEAALVAKEFDHRLVHGTS